MARYRPKGLGLERVLGVGALVSTAYGNVGSSIYYALGVVAVFALGLTPVAYLIAGLIFVMTAMTYTEAATNFPEAGGSASFARRAFNEFTSFFAAWGQMLNYVLAVVDFATQIFLVVLGVALVLNFGTLIDNVHLWQAPNFTDFALSITVAM